MENLKHTQGEWIVSNYGHCISVEVILENGQEHTIVTDQFCHASKFNGNAEANAKLIAAAPEMLEALIKCSNINKVAREHISDELFETINNAINKATK